MSIDLTGDHERSCLMCREGVAGREFDEIVEGAIDKMLSVYGLRLEEGRIEGPHGTHGRVTLSTPELTS